MAEDDGTAPVRGARKTYALTGTSSGIGKATVERLRTEGHEVITVGRQGADVNVQLWEPDDRRRAVAEVAERCGGVLDGVVTFAAAGPSSPPRSGRLVVGVNYFGTVELLLGMRPFLARANAPAAIAIGSNVTTHGAVQRRLLEACLAGDESLATSLGEAFGPALSYMSSKTALSHWVRRNAVKPEWIGAGITLNLVAPGTTDTPQLAEVRDNPVTAAALAEYPVPLGRVVRPEEMAGVVAYLLGPDARIFCGAVLFADGGSDAFLRPDDWPLPPPERQLND